MEDRFEQRILVDCLLAALEDRHSTGQRRRNLLNFTAEQENTLGIHLSEAQREAAEYTGYYPVLRRRGRQFRREAVAQADAPSLSTTDARRAIVAKLRRRSVALATARPGPFARTLAAFAETVGLDTDEATIVASLARWLESAPSMQLLEAFAGPERRAANVHVLAQALEATGGHDRNRLRRILGPHGSLVEAGILEIDPDGDSGLTRPVQRALYRGEAGADRIREVLVGTPRRTTLDWADFDHLAAARDQALAILSGALAQRAAGVHLLLYGPPGTGKTELALALGAAAGDRVAAVGESDEDEDVGRRGTDRLAAWRLAQRVAGRRPGTVLLLDEADDLFDSDSFATFVFGEPRARGSQASLHRRIESAPVPTIWTSNWLGAMPAAVRRRFAFAIHMRQPPVGVRQRIWRRLLDRHAVAASEADCRRLARSYDAVPAVAAGAARAAALSGGGLGAVDTAVTSIVEAMRGGRPLPPLPHREEDFDPRFANAGQDLAAFADRLARSGERRFSLCLHGAPGTGKTAFSRYLAERLALPVRQKRASDLLSKWVGESEQNIAEAFAEARAEQAFLVFDEADSLLADRRDAWRAWEITRVNEMLTWMESHDLPFACTTNLMKRLDAASLRRFTFKIEFRWLGPGQAAGIFRRFFDREPPAALGALDRLTPGDFAVVRARARVLGGEADAAALVAMLAEEVAAKPGARQHIGFRGNGA